jgi:peptidoglycan/xylan/chitin deacetylase (PgdA/CDA1 family)
MWHYVRTAYATPSIDYHGVTPDAFGRQLDAIATDYLPIGWAELVAAMDDDQPLPPDAVVLTFDDGLVDHHRTVLPALVERGLSGLFFILTREPGDGLTLGHRIHILRGVWPAEQIRDAVLDRLSADDAAAYRQAMATLLSDRPVDRDDVWKRPLQRELADASGPILSALVEEVVGPEADVAEALYLAPGQLDDLERAGMTLGGHTRTHPWLDALDLAHRRRELAASARALASRSVGPWPFAYPYGAVPGDAAALLAEAGFGAAFTTDPADRADRFYMGRVDGDDPTWASQLAAASTAGGPRR